MTAPTFTVVMPAHDAAATIESAIRSALAQTRGDFELIVVDDGSEDETLSVARAFCDDPRVRVLTQRRAGPAAARNRAIAAGRGRYVSMLDADDLWLPSYLAAVAGAFEAEPEAGLAYTDAWTLDDPPGRIRRRPDFRSESRPAPWLGPDALVRALAPANFIKNSTVSVRRSALDAVGRCNVELAAASDYELWLRLGLAGFGAARAPGCHAVYRVRSGSIQHGPEGRMQAYHALRDVYHLLADEWNAPPEVSEIARVRIREIDLLIEDLHRPRSFLQRPRVRVPLGRAKRFLLGRLLWLPAPPPELRDLLEPE